MAGRYVTVERTGSSVPWWLAPGELGGFMRWYALALCAGIALCGDGCGTISAPAATGILAFQKDSSCADTVNTELFVDGVSQGQFVMGPGSVEGFNKSANTHIARATELAGKLRQFIAEAVVVPAGGSATYAMTCGGGTRPPPNPSPGW
jgi:hypothetical protein